jgi:CubicO group peptidase (beta-lactamase class C family)
LVSQQLHDEAVSVQFPGLAGVLPGFGSQRPNDWGLGFEIRDGKSPHWTGASNSPRTFGHFGQSGTFLWVDPAVELALVVLTDRDFGDWTYPLWPAISDEVLREFGAD